tara:strand:+ start:48694 stop:48981 length:288 start_codon:yes stop_codon:yes gene_type:complete
MKQEPSLNEEIICRICGVNWKEIFNTSRTDYYDNFCPCCGRQVGYQDSLPQAAKKARVEWLSSDAIWIDDDTEPKGWNKEMALAQIKANVPPEFQ